MGRVVVGVMGTPAWTWVPPGVMRRGEGEGWRGSCIPGGDRAARILPVGVGAGPYGSCTLRARDAWVGVGAVEEEVMGLSGAGMGATEEEGAREAGWIFRRAMTAVSVGEWVGRGGRGVRGMGRVG